MIPTQDSRTAQAAVAARAVATLSPNTTLIDDPYAWTFLDEHWKVLFSTSISRKLIAEGFYNKLVPGLGGNIVIRQCYVEAQLDKLIEQGLEQYVVLGAGWDSLSLRRRDYEDKLKIFEIDHPDTQRRKLGRMRDLGIRIPPNVSYVENDFETCSLADVLGSSHIDTAKPALILWGGVSYYLTRPAIDTLLCTLSRAFAPGTEIVFDYIDERAFGQDVPWKQVRRHFKMAERRGEPFLTGFPAGDMAGRLGPLGFELVANFVGAAQVDACMGRKIGPFTPSDYMHLCHARVAKR
jgi:methyltransferase (TIGR00027 family)